MPTTPPPGGDGAWLRARWLCDELAQWEITATPAIDPDTGQATGLVALDPADLRRYLPDLCTLEDL